jgi:hypothetical protein
MILEVFKVIAKYFFIFWVYHIQKAVAGSSETFIIFVFPDTKLSREHYATKSREASQIYNTIVFASFENKTRK